MGGRKFAVEKYGRKKCITGSTDTDIIELLQRVSQIRTRVKSTVGT